MATTHGHVYPDRTWLSFVRSAVKSAPKLYVPLCAVSFPLLVQHSCMPPTGWSTCHNQASADHVRARSEPGGQAGKDGWSEEGVSWLSLASLDGAWTRWFEGERGRDGGRACRVQDGEGEERRSDPGVLTRLDEGQEETQKSSAFKEQQEGQGQKQGGIAP